MDVGCREQRAIALLAPSASEGNENSSLALRVGRNIEKTAAHRWVWLGLLALAGYLLFAHGCHGDEDHELFGVVRTIATR